MHCSRINILKFHTYISYQVFLCNVEKIPFLHLKQNEEQTTLHICAFERLSEGLNRNVNSS